MHSSTRDAKKSSSSDGAAGRKFCCFFSVCGNRGVTGLDGARAKKASLAPPCSNLRSFGSKSTVLKKVLVTFLEVFGARGIVPPSLRPWAGNISHPRNPCRWTLLATLSLQVLATLLLGNHCYMQSSVCCGIRGIERLKISEVRSKESENDTFLREAKSHLQNKKGNMMSDGELKKYENFLRFWNNISGRFSTSAYECFEFLRSSQVFISDVFKRWELIET